MEIALPWIASVVAGLWIGSYFSPYLKKRSENLATHDDIDKLVDQVKATTEATKAIESRIDDQVWNKQRQWELKRDALVEGGRAVNELMSAVRKVNGAFSIDERPGDLLFGTQLANHQTEAMKTLNEATHDFQRSAVLVSVVSGREMQTAFVTMERILKDTASKIVDGDRAIFKQRIPLINTTAAAITNAIRKELKIETPSLEITPQSSESSVPAAKSGEEIDEGVIF